MLAGSLGVGGRRGASWFLTWGESRGVSRGRAGGWLRCFAPPIGGVVYRGSVQYPAFAPGSSEVAVGLFGLFVSCCPEFAPTAHARSYF